MRCGRCGRPAGGGPFCPHCGGQLLTLRWVAELPPSARPTPPAPRRGPYFGPPRYTVPPRWGFPALPWPTANEPRRTTPAVAVRTLGSVLIPTLWATAAVAVVAAGAEGWRYTLLLASRTEALPAGVVAASDALVSSAGLIAPVLTVLAGLLVVAWTARAMQAAADGAGVRPARSTRAVVLGWLVPGLNLTVPGSVLAEIEHAALGRPPGTRPCPSRLLLTWWVLWVGGVLLATLVALWSLRDGVQALADGVVLHALLDLLAATTAAVTAVVVARLTRLLAPVRPAPREVLMAVR